MDEVSLYKKHYQFHSKLDNVDTPNLSRIKEISKRIYFAVIKQINKFLITKVIYTTKQKTNLQDYIVILL